MKKKCSKCNASKDISKFLKLKTPKDGLQRQCKTCVKAYRRSKTYRDSQRKYMLKYWALNPERSKTNLAKYHATVNGHLRRQYHNMNQRCKSQESYIKAGVKNKFESANALISYVVGVMEVDPRGLDVHRINNDGHYEKGNIEFLTEQEHMSKHKRRNRRK